MSDGRTIWWPKDAAWWRREHVVELGEEFGADGPAVLDWLSCEAKAQNMGGTVKAGYRSLARGCFVDVVTVGHVVSRAVALGALDDFEGDERRFMCRISGWQSDNNRGRAAWRKAQSREAETPVDTEDQPPGQSVTDRDTPGHVTPGHAEFLTGQDSTEEKNPPTPQGGKVVTFDRRPVPRHRLETSERLLYAFNARAGTDYGAYTGDGKPSESLRRIIGALTRHPNVSAEQWEAAIR
ncbi:MAG TPA: hypothetical protein VGW38_24260, partial [Chloroflexota bacterium]|nr:hypothetical protein [Chloroflexota bacterium]